jgi:hypothetical protein
MRTEDTMGTSDSGEMLDEVGRLKRLAWADRRPSSVPLYIFGALAILSAAFELSDISVWRLVYWLIAGPTGFFLCAAWYKNHRITSGVGAGRGSYMTTGVVLLISFVFVIPLWIIALPTIGFALLVIAVRQRNTYLAICATFFGVTGFLVSIFTFDNQLYRLAHYLGYFKSADGYFSGATAMVDVMWGLLMVAAGLIAHRREVMVANA